MQSISAQVLKHKPTMEEGLETAKNCLIWLKYREDNFMQLELHFANTILRL